MAEQGEHIEWGTLLPNGNVCAWPDEAKARHAALISQTFPDGAHPLMRRRVGAWEHARERPGMAERDLTPQQIIDSGLLWAINRTLLHPRGYALGLDPDSGMYTLWGNGDEPWQFGGVDERAKMVAFNELLASVTSVREAGQ